MQSEPNRILIVDDEPDICEMISTILKRYNIDSDLAFDGQQALSLMRQNSYNAVLCDIKMPNMNGLECLVHAQADGHTAPFVFVTGFEDRDRMLQAIRLGALDFIGKPFYTEELVDVVCRATEIGRFRDRIRNEIASRSDVLLESVKKGERLITLMRARNNRKRCE